MSWPHVVRPVGLLVAGRVLHPAVLLDGGGIRRARGAVLHLRLQLQQQLRGILRELLSHLDKGREIRRKKGKKGGAGFNEKRESG